MSSIKYMVVPTQDTNNNDNFYSIYGPRDKYLELIKSMTYLRQVKIGTQELEIFENPDFRPRFYLTSQQDTISSATISAQSVSYIRRNAAEYEVKIASADFPQYLNFSDLFHPGWKVSPRPLNWINVILNRQPTLLDSQHLQNDAGLNTFLITPSSSTGSELVFTIYFQPQAYLNLGLIISAISGLMVIIYLSYISLKKLHG